MNITFAKSTVWQLVGHADTLTAITLLTLFFMSIFCWTVLLYKWILWRIKKQHLKTVLDRLQQAKTIEDVVQITANNTHTLPGYFLTKALHFLKDTLINAEKNRTVLTIREWSLLEQSLYQVQEEIYFSEEHFNSAISTCATLSPLIGLFGTVWGLINSFLGISHQQSADITAVAPGIAQALIATIAGLLVAIPAYVVYNLLQLQLRALDQKIAAISERFCWLAQPLFAEKQKEV